MIYIDMDELDRQMHIAEALLLKAEKDLLITLANIFENLQPVVNLLLWVVVASFIVSMVCEIKRTFKPTKGKCCDCNPKVPNNRNAINFLHRRHRRNYSMRFLFNRRANTRNSKTSSRKNKSRKR